ncbi:hypothetical protein P9112_009581 [Eukaryota sp. TZLM1-RC]
MSSFATPDAKKEEFRKYLEKCGIIDTLTKALVALYEETDRPVNGLEYLRQYLEASSGPSDSSDVDALRTENEDLKRQNDELRQSLQQMNVEAQ